MSLIATFLVTALWNQDAFPPDRYGAYVSTIDGLKGPVDAVGLPEGGLLVVERDADRLTRIAPDGTKSLFGPRDLDAPEDIAPLPGGGWALCDTGNDRVLLLDANGAMTGEVGGRGDGPSDLRTPLGVAASADTLYVADSLNARVQAFALGTLVPRHSFKDLARPVAVAVDADGGAYAVDAGTHAVVALESLPSAPAERTRRRESFGDFGPHPEFLGHPRDIEIQDERIYVADADNHRIQVFDLDGEYVYEWGKHAFQPREGEGSLHYPSGVALISGGARAVVCEAFGDRLQVFGRTEEDPAKFMTDPGLMPWKVSPHYGPLIATAGDILAIFEPETQTILVHDLELDVPVEVTRFGAYGSMPGQHQGIMDLLVEPGDWRVGVVERGKISWWALDHQPDAPLKMKPRMASFARSTMGGASAAVERAWGGRLVYADRSRGVHASAADGGMLQAPLDDVVDMAFDGELLWAVDRGARQVLALAEDLSIVHRLEGFRRPRGVAVAPNGEVYVTDEVAHVVRVFGVDPSGAYSELRSFGGEGLGAGELNRPAGIVIDERDRVIVLDHGNHRGMIFDREGSFLLAFGPRGYVKPTIKKR